MKVLVTGASGWVGEAVCRALLRRGERVVAPTRSPLSSSLPVQAVAFTALDGLSDFTQALGGVDVLVHLASRVHVMRDTAADPLALYRKVNVEGTLNLARQAAAAGVRRFVFMSSVKVNGEKTQAMHPFVETDAAQPQDPYGVSKWEAEEGLRALAVATGMECVIIRPPLVYGPGVKANFKALMQLSGRGWPLPLGAIHNQRSLIALGNLVDFVLLCMTHPAAANQTFLVSDGHDLSTTDLVRGLAQAQGRRVILLPVPVGILLAFGRLLGQGAALQRLCGNLQIDSGKARQLLAWVPPLSVEQGLRLAVEGHGHEKTV